MSPDQIAAGLVSIGGAMKPARWIVAVGALRYAYYTEYHAEQMARALCLHGLRAVVTYEGAL